MKLRNILALIAGGVLYVALPLQADAASVSMVTFSVVDEFNEPLTSRIPEIEVGNCSVDSVESVKSNGVPGQFIATVAWKNFVDRSCSFTVGARGYVTGGTQETGILDVGSTKNINTPFRLAYPLVVSVYDESQLPINNAVVEFGGVQAIKKINNTYYFAESGEKPLVVFADGFGNVTTNTALARVLVQKNVVTTVRLQGSAPCTVASTTMNCAALTKPLTVKVVDEMGVVIPEASVTLYKDFDFTNVLATQVGGESKFAVAPGTYRGKVVTRNFNDVLFTVTVGNVVKEKVITIEKVNGSKISPQDSRIRQIGGYIADGATNGQVQVEVISGDGTSTRLRDVTVEVKSNRGSVDVISIPQKITNSSGIVTAFITSTQMGTAYLDVYANSVWIGTMSVYFNEPPVTSNVPASATRSTVTTSVSPILADGIEKVTVTVTVRNAIGARIQNAKVTMSSNRNGDVIIPKESITNEKGEAVFTFSTKVPGTAWISARVDAVEIIDIGVISVSPLVI